MSKTSSPSSSSSSETSTTAPVVSSSSGNDNHNNNKNEETDSSSRSLNWWRLSAIVFVFTSCGPFGIESCVSTGGAFYTLLTVFITPLVYVIPQVLMVSELSMMMPSNHGHIAWVERGWGRFAGAFNAYNALLTNSIDLSLYPVLGGNYFVAHFLPGASDLMKAIVRCTMVLVGLIIALRSAKVVSDAALTVSCIIIIPFLFLFIVSIPRISPSTQWYYSPNPEGKVDWAAFSASSLWLYTGWNSLGSLGGDVENGNSPSGRKVFLKGLSFALVWDILMYLLPLVSALTVPNGSWDDGYLSVAFGKILPGAGLVVSVCGMISTMGLFVSSLACYSRMIWGMADLGWLPKFLAKADAQTHSPTAATIAQVVAILPLLLLSFSYLQRLEFCLAAVSYLLTFGAFLKLRYDEPNADRPYIVPGGLPVAWLITMSKVGVFVWILISNFDDSSLMIGVAVVNSSIALGYYWLSKKYPEFAQSHGFVHEDDQEPGARKSGEATSQPTSTSTRKNSDEDILVHQTNSNNNSNHLEIPAEPQAAARRSSSSSNLNSPTIPRGSSSASEMKQMVTMMNNSSSSVTTTPLQHHHHQGSDSTMTIRKRPTSSEKLRTVSSREFAGNDE